MRFFSPEVALYLYKSTEEILLAILLSCLANASSCYLNVLGKLQKWVCRTVGPSFAFSLEPLAHCWNLPSLSLFCGYCFGRSSSELAELVPLLHSHGKSTKYYNRLHDFSVTIYSSDKGVSFFAQLDSGIVSLQNAFIWPMI